MITITNNIVIPANSYKLLTWFCKNGESFPRFDFEKLRGKKLLIKKAKAEAYKNYDAPEMVNELNFLRNNNTSENYVDVYNLSAKIEDDFGTIETEDGVSFAKYDLKINGKSILFETSGASCLHPRVLDEDNLYLLWDEPMNSIEFSGWIKPNGNDHACLILMLGVYVL